MDRKREILAAIKLTGAASLTELAERLQLTKQGAQRHLEQLRRQGLVELVDTPEHAGPGRPQHRYRLTPDGQQEFPHGHQALAVELVEFIPPAELDAFFRARAARQEQTYAAGMHGDTVSERAGELARAAVAAGHMTELERDADGALRLRHHHCPIQDVAQKTGYPCQCERDMYARLLGAHVTRETWLGAGDTTCGYRIDPTSKE